MLGAQPMDLAGVVERFEHGELANRASIQLKTGDQWRMQMDDGPLIESNAEGSMIKVGHESRVGPPINPQNIFGASLVMPRYALIWGRPGEDWRLSDIEPSRASDPIHLRLAPTSGENREGFALVDRKEGFLRRLTIGTQEWHLHTS
jgi:hypothetical protein